MNAETAYDGALRKVGRPILLRRIVGTGIARVNSDYPVFGRMLEKGSANLVGGEDRGDNRWILSASSLTASQFPIPIVPGDKLVVDGHESQITETDGESRRKGSEVLAYVVRVRG